VYVAPLAPLRAYLEPVSHAGWDEHPVTGPQVNLEVLVGYADPHRSVQDLMEAVRVVGVRPGRRAGACQDVQSDPGPENDGNQLSLESWCEALCRKRVHQRGRQRVARGEDRRRLLEPLLGLCGSNAPMIAADLWPIAHSRLLSLFSADPA
jgi:hypothetical protein